MSYYIRTVFIAMALLGAVLFTSGCGGGGGGTKTTAGGVQLLLADDPLNVDAVNVTISRVQVSKDGEGWTTVKDFGASPATINLLDYRYDGNPDTMDNYLLADSPLTTGHYTQIRLILTKVEIVDADGTTEVQMSSQDKTGLKLVGDFDVAADARTAVLIDFNVAKSIVKEGNGTYRLKPTVRVVPVDISGTIHGLVAFKAEDGTTDVAVPEGATISAYQGDTLIASALINADGSYGMSGLLAGDYTLKLETTGFTAADQTATAIARTAIDAGTMTATATPAPAP